MNTELFLAIQNRDKVKVQSLLPTLTQQDSNEGVYLLFKEAMHHRENETIYAEILQLLLKKFPDTEVNSLAAFVDGQPLVTPYLAINEQGKDSFTVYDNIYDLSTKRIEPDPSHTVLVPSKEVKKDGVMDRLPQGTCRIIRHGIVQDYTKFYPSTPLMIAVSFELVNMMNALLKYSKVDVSIKTLVGGVWDINYDRKTPGVVSIGNRTNSRAIDFPTNYKIHSELEKIHLSVFVQEGMNKKSTESELMIKKYSYKPEGNSYWYGTTFLKLVCDHIKERSIDQGGMSSDEEHMKYYVMWEAAIQNDSLLFSVLETERMTEKIRASIYQRIVETFKRIPNTSFEVSVKRLMQYLSKDTAIKVVDEMFIMMKNERTKESDMKFALIIKALLNEFHGINVNSIKTDFHSFDIGNNYNEEKWVVYDKCTYFMIAHRYKFHAVMNLLLSNPEVDVTIPIEISENHNAYDRDYEEYNLESKTDKYNNYYTSLKSNNLSNGIEKIRQAHIKQFTREASLGKAEDMEKLLKKHDGVDLTPKEIRMNLTKQIMEQ